MAQHGNIHTHRWLPHTSEEVSAGPQTHCIYLLHGAGEHAARYAPFATYLAERGWQVGAHDHPGHGQSSGQRGVIDPPGALVTQAAIQIMAFATECHKKPIVFAHSMGAVAATELVLEHGLPVAGLILSAPAFVPIIGPVNRLKARLAYKLAPQFTVHHPYSAEYLTHDPDVAARAEQDPLNHGFKSAGLVGWLMTSGQRQIDNAPMLNTPTLLLIAGDDQIVDSAAIEQFAAAAPNACITHKRYAGYAHEILNETPERVELVYADVAQWLDSLFGG